MKIGKYLLILVCNRYEFVLICAVYISFTLPLLLVLVCLYCAETNSDRRLKDDIEQVGRSPSGIPIYTFKYRDDMADFLRDDVDTNSVYIGAMAQDLLDIFPKAVATNPKTGYYDVDYSMIDIDFRKI